MEAKEIRRHRLTQLIATRYESQADFIRQTGENQGEISAILGGKKSFGEKKARKIEEKCGLELGWLDALSTSEAGYQHAIATAVAIRAENATEGARAVSLLPDVFQIPQFDARASMGEGFPVPEYDRVVERIEVTRSWVHETLPSVTNPKNLALLPAFGDSMEGTFNDGDLLWVDRGVHEVKIDAVYVLALRDELYIKRLQRRPDGSILMISDNKKYEPYLIQNGEREKFRVLGRVVYAWCGKKV